MAKKEYLNIPIKSWETWFSEYVVSSLVLHAWDKKKGQPTKICKETIKVEDVKPKCKCGCHKGEGKLTFDIDYV